MSEEEKKEKKIPTPEEIQKELEEIIRNKFGGHVQFFASVEKEEKEETAPPKEKKKKWQLNFNFKPKDIKSYLDQYVVKQDEAKKALSIAVCDHYNHVKNCLANPERISSNYSKQNILLLGPTGVGKTYLIKNIAKLIGVPFVRADATRFSETGYVGANVEDLIKDLVAQANGDLELAQYGIVYLDEADKLATPPGSIIGRDVSGRGVQIGLLKLMEETEVNLKSGHDLVSQIQTMMEFQKKGKVDRHVINTRHILFIISGAFNGLTDIVKTRLKKGTIGLQTEQKALQTEDYYPLANTQDFINAGLEPEFIGRLPVRVSCRSLNKDDLFQIMKEVKDNIVEQYKESFAAYGVTAFFADDGLKKIAQVAAQEKTGARALMTVFEKVLRDYKYELPSSGITQIVINAELVQNPEKVLKKILQDPVSYQDQILKFLVTAGLQTISRR